MKVSPQRRKIMAWKLDDRIKGRAVWDRVYAGRSGEEMLKVIEKFEKRFGAPCIPLGTWNGGFEIGTLYPEVVIDGKTLCKGCDRSTDICICEE
jgi:hypothetical protein